MIHNQLHTVDLVIIGAYLIAMVMVGLVVVRKVKNMDDYYLGGRSFGPLCSWRPSAPLSSAAAA